MRLAVLFHRLGPYHVARLARAASASGNELVAVELSGSGGEYAWDRVTGHGFDRVTVAPEGDSNDLTRRELRLRVVATLDRVRPDVLAVAGWSDPGMRVAARWGTRHHKPMILMSDSQYIDERRVWYKEWVKRRRVAAFRAGFVAGTPHRDYLARLGMDPARVTLGYDAVDNDHFATGADAARAGADTLRSKLGLPEKFFLTVARFVPKKNLTMLIDAYAEYRKLADAPPWHLMAVGNGPMRTEIVAAIRRNGVADSVHLPGFRQYHELPAYYGLASGFVLPSVQEQWGLVVNEALAAGVPVLASIQCGCMPDLLGGKSFSPHDPHELARQMLDLTRTNVDRAAERARVADWGLDRFAAGLWGATRWTC